MTTEYTPYGILTIFHWQSHRSELTSTIGTITAANVDRIVIACRENWASVVNYVQLNKRDLKVVKHVDMPAQKILTQGSDGLRNRDLEEKFRCLHNFRYAIRTCILPRGCKGPRRTPLRSNTIVVPVWVQAQETKGDLVGEGPTYGGCDDFSYSAFRYIYSFLAYKKNSELRPSFSHHSCCVC